MNYGTRNPKYPLKQLRRLHRTLLKIKRGPKDNDGICCHIERYSGAYHYENKRLCRALWVHWEHFSGRQHYPVPARDGLPAVAFHSGASKWNPNTEYGMMRWKLLQYLIEQVETMIDFMVEELGLVGDEDED